MIGFVYDIIFAGIPYPDPTPEHQSDWQLQKFIASIFYKTGGIIFLLGIAAIPAVWIRTKNVDSN